MSGMVASPESRSNGSWTPEEIERNERVNRARAARDHEKAPRERLEETVRLSRFIAELRRVSPAMFEPDDLLLRLRSAQVDFVVIGGVAVGVHGFIRATKDLDIVPDPAAENLARLARVLVEIEAQHVGLGDFSALDYLHEDPAQLAEGANFRLETSRGPLGILQQAAGMNAQLAYNDLAPAAIAVPFRDTVVQVCSLEHLRAMKQAAGREQDLQDLGHLSLN
jgi:hypothetical protein